MSFFTTILSRVYGFFVGLRNLLYDEHLLHSAKLPIPTICIGNLSVGGTGKTPHTEFFAGELQQHYKVAVLSRGYRRKTRGFLLVDDNANAFTVGDEALQLHHNLPEVIVAVCENRVRGCRRLMRLFPDLEVILLDDGFQHRRLHCGFYVLLTAADNLFIHDHLLPHGRLREHKMGSLRANMVIVTKCPEKMQPIDKRVIDTGLHLPPYQQLFFSWLNYGQLAPLQNNAEQDIAPDAIRKPLLLTGIAQPQPLIDYLKARYPQMETMRFADHHRFTARDMQHITKCYTSACCDALITTQKDAMRLLAMPSLPPQWQSRCFVLPVQVDFHGEEKTVMQLLENYIKENRRRKR